MAKKKERRPANSSMSRPRAERGAHVLEAVGDGERELLHRGRARLLHVVAGDRDRVELRHAPGRVLDDVGHDPHARLGRIDVGVADHELLEDVVLDGPGELLLVDALLLGGDDVAGEHRAAPRRSWSSRRSSCRAGCRRRGSSCPRPSRWRRRPCRRRRRPAGGRCRSRGGWRGRRPPTAPSARRRGWPGRRRSTPRRWRSPAYWRMVQGRFAYIVARTPRRNGSKPGSVADGSRGPRGRRRCRAGWTSMPSGVVQVSASRSPLTSFAASASQSDRVGRSLSPMRERVRPAVRTGEVGGGQPGAAWSAGLRQLLGGDRVLERPAGPGDARPAHACGCVRRGASRPS